ncbi:MAG TPA: ABC transporter permease [Galbitalea sp.]|jgi:osmoprotectant transport system permease protein|nr:ABC transporter permease [Galbitalea sp.]
MIILQAFAWIFDPAHYTTTALGTGIPEALVNHLLLAGVSLGITIVIALPLGLYIGHTGKGRTIAIVASNVVRAFPSLGMIAIFFILFQPIFGLGYNFAADVVAFILLGVPPLLAGAYSGLEAVDRQTIDAARAIGMTEWQVLTKVEIPLGAQLIVGGLRSSTLQIIATVTIASLYGQVSLGTYIANGLAQSDYVQMLAGAILVIALALIADGLLAIVQRLVVPRGVSRVATKHRNTASGSLRPATPGTPIKEGN